MTLDIHNYQQQFAYAEGQVRASTISDRNKTLIFGYRDACLIKGTCGRVRLIRVLGALKLFATMFAKDFDRVAKEDIERLIATLMGRQPAYSAATMGTYKAILKSFMTWVVTPDDFPTKTPPAIVAWIRTHVRRKDLRRLERKDLLTPEDIQALLDICRNPRDKALIAMLWETGCRIAELGNLQLKHVTKTPHGYSLDVTGKTGGRNPMVVSSAPYLTVWLNNHPFKTDPEAPLWVHYEFGTEPKPLRYDSIRFLLRRYFQRAKITKPFHPHAFRHSRATYVLANAIMNESQAKSYFGWTPDSGMIATYAHLIDADANNAILKENNLAPLKRQATDLLPVTCTICSELNPPRTDYCTKCGAVLNLAKAYEHQQVRAHTDDLVMSIFRILVEKGLVDEAAAKIHEAGLGPTLKRLADHHTGAKPFGAIAHEPTNQSLGEMTPPNASQALGDTPASLPMKQ